MLKDLNPDNIDNWACVMERGTEYEIEMAKDYLANIEIPSNILSNIICDKAGRRAPSLNMTCSLFAI